MKIIYYFTAVFAGLSLFAAPSPNYYDSAQGKSGPSLRVALHGIIRNHTVLPYSSTATDTSDALKVLDEDPANTNNVILIYERSSAPKSMFGLTNGWNREHLWPNSYGLDDIVPEFSDLHNLRAIDATVNSARGNKFYDVSNPLDSNYKKPGHAEAPLTSTDSDSWEPPAIVKGDIARAAFYMDVRYEGDATKELNLILTDKLNVIGSATNLMGRLSTFLIWNQNDPVDASENLRNDQVDQLYQHNRNPFVDHPEWANLIFAPTLELTRTLTNLNLRWTSNISNAVVEASQTLPGNWQTLTNAPTLSGETWTMSIAGNSNQFFRLRLRF